MKKMMIVLLGVCSSLSVFAGHGLSPLSDKDLSALESGASCWLANAKSEMFIFDDMNHAVIRLGTKVVKLNKKSGDWKSGFYDCGKTYEYVSEDQKVTVSVQMKPAKAGKCTGQISVVPGKSVVSSLKSDCGA